MIAKYERPFKCAAAPCKFCCFQYMLVKNDKNKIIGSIREKFWLCVPTFDVMSADGNVLYEMHMSTCFNGKCIDCTDQECTSYEQCTIPCICNSHFPFHIYRANDNNKSQQSIGKVCKLSAGYAQDYTYAGNYGMNTFEIVLPRRNQQIHLSPANTTINSIESGVSNDSILPNYHSNNNHHSNTYPPNDYATTDDAKATIIGGFFLINQLFYQQSKCSKLCLCGISICHVS